MWIEIAMAFGALLVLWRAATLFVRREAAERALSCSLGPIDLRLPGAIRWRLDEPRWPARNGAAALFLELGSGTPSEASLTEPIAREAAVSAHTDDANGAAESERFHPWLGTDPDGSLDLGAKADDLRRGLRLGRTGVQLGSVDLRSGESLVIEMDVRVPDAALAALQPGLAIHGENDGHHATGQTFVNWTAGILALVGLVVIADRRWGWRPETQLPPPA